MLDWSEINKTGDWLARNKTHPAWGPGRHIIGHNIATYHRNSDAVRVEIFTELDQTKDEALGYFEPRPWHQEFPLDPKMHGPETLRNYWLRLRARDPGLITVLRGRTDAGNEDADGELHSGKLPQ